MGGSGSVPKPAICNHQPGDLIKSILVATRPGNKNGLGGDTAERVRVVKLSEANVRDELGPRRLGAPASQRDSGQPQLGTVDRHSSPLASPASGDPTDGRRMLRYS